MHPHEMQGLVLMRIRARGGVLGIPLADQKVGVPGEGAVAGRPALMAQKHPRLPLGRPSFPILQIAQLLPRLRPCEARCPPCPSQAPSPTRPQPTSAPTRTAISSRAHERPGAPAAALVVMPAHSRQALAEVSSRSSNSNLRRGAGATGAQPPALRCRRPHRP